MAAKQTPPLVSTSEFATLKQIRFLRSLQRLRLSGQLLFAPPHKQPWSLHLHLGSIIYATGGTHPVRRWYRNLAAYCPKIPTYSAALQRDLVNIDFKNCWEYQLLELWVKQQRITREQAAKMIRAVIGEVLFDLAQATTVTNQIQREQSLSTKLVLIEIEGAIADVQPLWQAWQDAHLSEYSPNLSPVIKHPDELRRRASPEVYHALNTLLDGQYTLRDLALRQQWNVVELTRSLLPYLRLGSVELTTIPDLPVPSPMRVSGSGTLSTTTTTDSNKPLVACVDDSLWVIRTMEKVIAAAGYRFIGVDNALRAIPMLLGKKPDLIFLDLVMPNVNGYEICTQLRKLSCFRTTPIVILTGKDGTSDRIQAKLVGASDFLSKPLDARKLLSVLHKHLKQGVISH